MLGVFGFGGGEILILLLLPLALAYLAFWVWALVLAVQNKGLSDGERIGWVLAIVFVHFIGALLYFLIAHPKRNLPRPAGPGA